MFSFLVLCGFLSKPEHKLRALRELKERVFSDSRAWIPKISFRDPEGRVEQIFKLYDGLQLVEVEEEEKKGLVTQVRPAVLQISPCARPSGPRTWPG